MKNYFSISQAAAMLNITTETLRHYDRISLVKPSWKDPNTGYRYYSNQEIIQLRTIQLLRYMDLSLAEIKEILSLRDLSQVILFLRKAEQKADEKIATLQYAKSKIERALSVYEKKEDHTSSETFIKYFPQRVILLSQELHFPSLENLWNYHRTFYEQLEESQQEFFAFEDTAGIFQSGDSQHLFAVCKKYPSLEGLRLLPEGFYLCKNCLEDEKEETSQNLVQYVKKQYHIVPEFIIQNILVTGILTWDYQIHLFWGKEDIIMKESRI